MLDRITLIDGLCRECRRVLRREDVSELSPRAADALKAEIEGQGLVAAHYTAAKGSVTVAHLAHAPKCKTQAVPAVEQTATEVMAGAIGVKSQRAKGRRKK